MKIVPMFDYLNNLMNPKKIINLFLKILLIKNPIGLLNFGEESDESLIDFDEHQEYGFGDRGEVFSKLCINLGTSSIPRFSCVSLKCKIATRMAINKHVHLSETLVILQKYAVKVKKSIELIQDQINEKSKIHLNNQTRWSSQFLMLKSFHKTYLKDAFPTENPCPISFEVIETYLQILYPAYQFNLIMQKKISTLADVIPTLMIMFSKWKSIRLLVNINHSAIYSFLLLNSNSIMSLIQKFIFLIRKC